MLKTKIKIFITFSISLLFVGGFSAFADWPDAPEGSVIGGWLGEVFDLDNSDSTKLIVNSTNVGIGTTSPVQKLDVNGNIKATGRSLYLGDNQLYSDNSSALTNRTITIQ